MSEDDTQEALDALEELNSVDRAYRQRAIAEGARSLAQLKGWKCGWCRKPLGCPPYFYCSKTCQEAANADAAARRPVKERKAKKKKEGGQLQWDL